MRWNDKIIGETEARPPPPPPARAFSRDRKQQRGTCRILISTRSKAAAPGAREVGPTGNRFLCFSPCTKSPRRRRRKKTGARRRRRYTQWGREFRFIDVPTRIGTSVRLYTGTRAHHLSGRREMYNPLYIYRRPPGILFIYKDAAVGARV